MTLDTVQLVGQAIRRIRKQKKLSLQALATQAGVAVGVLSQIERDLGNPSLRTLTRIQQALGVPLGALFEATDDVGHDAAMAQSGALEHLVRRSGARSSVQFGTPLLTKEMLSSVRDSRLQFMILNLRPGGSSGDAPLSYPAEKGGWVLKGSFQLELDGDTLMLHEGDSFQFDGSTPHVFSNPGTELASLLWIIAYAPLRQTL